MQCTAETNLIRLHPINHPADLWTKSRCWTLSIAKNIFGLHVHLSAIIPTNNGIDYHKITCESIKITPYFLVVRIFEMIGYSDLSSAHGF